MAVSTCLLPACISGKHRYQPGSAGSVLVCLMQSTLGSDAALQVWLTSPSAPGTDLGRVCLVCSSLQASSQGERCPEPPRRTAKPIQCFSRFPQCLWDSAGFFTLGRGAEPQSQTGSPDQARMLLAQQSPWWRHNPTQPVLAVPSGQVPHTPTRPAASPAGEQAVVGWSHHEEQGRSGLHAEPPWSHM